MRCSRTHCFSLLAWPALHAVFLSNYPAKHSGILQLRGRFSLSFMGSIEDSDLIQLLLMMIQATDCRSEKDSRNKLGRREIEGYVRTSVIFAIYSCHKTCFK